MQDGKIVAIATNHSGAGERMPMRLCLKDFIGILIQQERCNYIHLALYVVYVVIETFQNIP